MLMAGSPSPPPRPSPHSSQPEPSEDRFRSPQSPPGLSVKPDKLSSTGSQLTPPQSPEVDPEMHSILHPEPFPTEFWDTPLKGKMKRRKGSDAVNLAQRDPRSRIF